MTKFYMFATLTLLLGTTKYRAQSFTGGITLGASTTSVHISDFGLASKDIANGKNILGIEGGIFGRLNLGPVFIKPMLLISYQDGTVDFHYNDGTYVKAVKFNYGKVQTPLLFGIRLLGILRIEAGPVYNWIYTTKYNDVNKIERSGIGYRAGANIEFGIVNLGVAYQGLTNKSSGTPATFKTPNELIFSLALCFGGK